MANLIYSYSSTPHIKGHKTTKSVMIDVCIALLPACIMGVVYFGLMALAIIAVSVASAFLSEVIFYLIARKKFKKILEDFDFTSIVTGILISLIMGVQTPFYVVVLANVFAIVCVKLIFGGTGKNLVNPAIVGRVFAFISFSAIIGGGWVATKIPAIMGGVSINPTTGATILSDSFSADKATYLHNLDLFLGTGLAGCIGETCKLALLIGAVYLAIRRVINILLPFITISVCGLFTVCISGFDFSLFLPSILSGGLFLGALFMATDYTTSPNTLIGNVIYFTAIGLLTALLRKVTQMECISFAILLMNLVVPLIDKFIYHKPFGYIKQKKIKGVK